MARAARLRATAAVVVLFAVAAACGNDSGTAGTQDTPNTAPFATTAPVTTVFQDPNRQVVAGDAISVHYVGTLDSGEQFDSSRDRDQPLSFVVGSGQIIEGFDSAVVGMKLGEKRNVRIEPAQAYGDWSQDLVITVSRDQLPADVTVGQTLYSSSGQSYVVLELTDTDAQLDGNPPLAGKVLNFEIELVSFDSAPAS